MDLSWLAKFAPPIKLDLSFLDKFAPKTPAPSAPQTVPTQVPTPSKGTAPAMQTYEAIQGYNNSLSEFTNGATSWQDTVKGVVIHKIDTPTAEAISARIKVAAEQEQIPLTYALACLAIESTLDPACVNGNLGPGESNTANDPLGYDTGIAQLKLRYLVGYAPGVTDADTARAFALDVNRAIPYFCSLMAGKVLWAQNTIDANPNTKCDPRMRNKYLLATAAYNFGNTGVMTYFENGTFPSHCQHVINLETYFAQKLGLESIFANLPTV